MGRAPGVDGWKVSKVVDIPSQQWLSIPDPNTNIRMSTGDETESGRLPKGTMRERMVKDCRDAGYWVPNSSEYRARLLVFPLKSSLAQTSSVFLGAQGMLALGLRRSDLIRSLLTFFCG